MAAATAEKIQPITADDLVKRVAALAPKLIAERRAMKGASIAPLCPTKLWPTWSATTALRACMPAQLRWPRTTLRHAYRCCHGTRPKHADRQVGWRASSVVIIGGWANTNIEAQHEVWGDRR